MTDSPNELALPYYREFTCVVDRHGHFIAWKGERDHTALIANTLGDLNARIDERISQEQKASLIQLAVPLYLIVRTAPNPPKLIASVFRGFNRSTGMPKFDGATGGITDIMHFMTDQSSPEDRQAYLDAILTIHEAEQRKAALVKKPGMRVRVYNSYPRGRISVEQANERSASIAARFGHPLKEEQE